MTFIRVRRTGGTMRHKTPYFKYLMASIVPKLACLVPLAVIFTWHTTAYAQDGIVYETESIEGSPFPVTYHLVETGDGLYTPIGLRTPEGEGPFPMVLFASGNGGEGLRWVKDASHNMSWTLDRFLEAGYAVAWMRYRAEVDVPVYDGSPRIGRGWSGRPRFNRPPLDHEDVIAIIDYVKTLANVDASRIGYMGMSHGGEMLMKIASEYDGLQAGIASEPASAQFLARGPNDPNAASRPETAAVHSPAAQAQAVRDLHARIDKPVAMERLSTIRIPIFVQGRDRDHNQDTFRVNYELLVEAGKDVRWKSYDHDLHGFAYVRRNEAGAYTPDSIQREAVADSVSFFDEHLK